VIYELKKFENFDLKLGEFFPQILYQILPWNIGKYVIEIRWKHFQCLQLPI